MPVLVPCPSCARHVATSESSCPFCESALPSDLESRAIPGTSRRLSRAAMFTFATTLTAMGTIGACSDNGMTVAGYGCPNGDCPSAAPQDSGGAQPLYGLADATVFEDSGSADDASFIDDSGDASDAGEDAD